MATNTTVGIDVGTYAVKAVMVEHAKKNDRFHARILGTGISESKGLRHGYIVNSEEATESIKQAVRELEKKTGIKVKKAFISVGGVGLNGIVSKGEEVIGNPDSEVTDMDVSKAIQNSEQNISADLLLNRRMIHSIPLEFKLDGKPALGKITGLKGVKLEAKALFITCLESHINDLIEAVEEAGVEVADVMASPIAGSLGILTKPQKMAGCVLVNIGAETVSIVIYENDIPTSLEVFPIGSNDITNDIALGLKIPLEDAEHIKLGGIGQSPVPKKKLDDIVSARFSDMFELIESHLKKISRNGLLPAGAIISGGGSHANNIEDFAKSALNLPAKTAEINYKNGNKENSIDSVWSVAYGLCILGFNSEEEKVFNVKGMAKRTKGKVFSFLKQFLP